MFTLDNINVYIFNWKKVSNNSLLLYKNISNIIKNISIINCDEFLILQNDIKHIQLDDSHYYGSQYDNAIKNVQDDSILCIILGDNIPNNDFEKIFTSAIQTFNRHNVGVYAPNDKRCPYTNLLENIEGSLYNIQNTDCGFWFIHPRIVKKLKNLPYYKSKYGWV